MATINKKFGFLRTTLALWAGNLFAGRAGVVTDSTPGTLERWGWYDGSAWRFSATAGSAETFSSVVLSDLAIYSVPRLDANKKTVASAFTDDGTTASCTRALGVTTTVAVTAISGQATIAALSVNGQNAVNVAYTAGVNRWMYGKLSDVESGSETGSSFIIRAYNDAGTQIDNPLTIFRAAGGQAVFARPLKVTTGFAAFNVTPPTVRPTVNAAATDLATVVALTNQLRTHLIACGLVQ